MDTNDTPNRLLDAAQQLVQERGYNAFSYRDLAEAVGIRTASIHYHFKTKADLGEALMARQLRGLIEALDAIDAEQGTQTTRIKKLVALYKTSEGQGAICLCGSLASDLTTLPDALQASVKEYLDSTERWLKLRLNTGIQAGEFNVRGKTADAASTFLACLQGALLLHRVQGGPSLISKVERSFLATIQPE